MSSQNASTVPATGTARSDGLLRAALVADVILTGANGIGYLALATVLDSFLGVPLPVQYAVGIFLTVYALWVLTVSRQQNISRGAVTVVITLNAAWAVAGVVTVVLDTLTATTAGNGWIVFQGLVVAAMGAVQYAGLRRM
ncbi:MULTISPECIES: hypothetical protein [unclassified Streptomyces]|uniref:hypothetical protein n=1 Tax=unclassified Streptomyces TaxID=2593676 RepID=UPI002E167097|nr:MULTISPECIES: hypothetical protein [unclassified Streptomyces]WSJ38720.1 hypothetical protein OG772_23735 [Streptomyces sp. NBC_01321]WSP55131.1 hypothetical protein OG306_12570 [Streptomyces sp. NBC_01241]WSP65012.1 hypothetical protein OG466_26355 [Streptomyces sp. NBC_01240]